MEWQRRYSLNGHGRTAKAYSHIVKTETQKSLCGRNAADWFKMDFSDELTAVDCDTCKRMYRDYESKATP